MNMNINADQMNAVIFALVNYVNEIKTLDVDYPSSVIDEMGYNPDLIEGDDEATEAFYEFLNEAVEAADEIFDAGFEGTAAECFAAEIIKQMNK